MEAENAFSLSLVRNEQITAADVWELKTQTLKKSGLLSLHRGTDNFSHLGGLSALKSFCKRALLHPSRDNPLKRARGLLLLSPPGCGKSQFCKLLGNEVGRPVLTVDIGVSKKSSPTNLSEAFAPIGFTYILPTPVLC